MSRVCYDGVVLAGGAATRLGGAHKPGLVVGGRRLLDVALDALDGALRVIVAGPPQPTRREVTWVRESPIGGGPAAALAAGLAEVSSPAVVVLAADLPFVTSDAVGQLVDALGAASAALAVDADGRDQPLLGCYDCTALREAVPVAPDSVSMRRIISGLGATGEVRRVKLAGAPLATVDCDTPDDITRARELA